MATGNTLLVFSPLSNEPPTSNYATLDTRNQHPVLDFNDSVNESSVFSAVMPQHYSGNGITVYIHYAMSSATSGYVDLDVALERIGDQQQDIDSDGFAAANSINNVTVPIVSGNVGIVSIPFTDGTDMDSVTTGEGFRLKVTRNAVNDTAVGDLEILKIEIRET